MISPVQKHKVCPSDHATYRGLLVFHPQGNLLALSYLHRLDEEMHCRGWLGEEQVGFHLGH